MLGTLLSIITSTFGLASSIKQGAQLKEILGRLRGLEGKTSRIEKLSSEIFYMPDVHVVRDISRTKQKKVENVRKLKQILDPVQKTLKGDILSSAIIVTPEKMQKAMKKDIWEVLLEVRPLNHAKTPNDPDMVPIMFEDGGTHYIGWQKQATLPLLFNCEYHPESELWLPHEREAPLRPIEELPKEPYRKTAKLDPDLVVYDPETMLMWTRKDNGRDVNWHEANQYARNLRLGGYTDWRLPTIDELEGICDHDNVTGEYDVYKIHTVSGFQFNKASMWSATKRDSESAWFFNFLNVERYSTLFDVCPSTRAVCVRRSEE